MSKIALCIGINYTNTTAELNGCINDATKMSKLLTDTYHFDSVNVLTDTSDIKPIYANILNALYSLVIRARSENVSQVLISYSGHGSYMRDVSSDESDGYDELLVPLDYTTKGMISDDVLSKIFNYFPDSCQVVTLFDCCHSGTLLDLKYNYDCTTQQHIQNNTRYNLNNNILMISGCRDNQTSADAYNLHNQRQYSGAMTSAFLDALENSEYIITTFALIEKMTQYLQQHNFDQRPQVASSCKLTNESFFSLLLKNHKVWLQ